MKLLTTSNAKIIKGEGRGYLTGGLHLAPYNLSGYNVCQKASEQCIKSCLNTAGRGVYTNTQEARIRKTKMFFEDRVQFFKLLEFDIQTLIRKAAREDVIPVLRLNLTSDLPWDTIKVRDGMTIMQLYPDVQFYDYTKRTAFLKRPNPQYDITFSRSESNDQDCYTALSKGFNVAVVMSLELVNSLDQYKGRLKLHCGDDDDLRFLDPKGKYGRIVYLTPKGKARRVKEEGFIMQSLESLNKFNAGFNAYLRKQNKVVA